MVASLVKELRHQFPFEILLQLVDLKRSTLAEKDNKNAAKNAAIVQKITEIYHKNDGNYGYRRIMMELRKI
ncbi:putative transposase insK for insertion sequence element IS150 [Glaesserella parasuis H465]|nr:putative transposase insK for insertion sequence element IS150 [Glaesserella parasuis H465]